MLNTQLKGQMLTVCFIYLEIGCFQQPPLSHFHPSSQELLHALMVAKSLTFFNFDVSFLVLTKISVDSLSVKSDSSQHSGSTEVSTGLMMDSSRTWPTDSSKETLGNEAGKSEAIAAVLK